MPLGDGACLNVYNYLQLECLGCLLSKSPIVSEHKNVNKEAKMLIHAFSG